MDLSAITWRPGIGDPTVGGWVTVVLYFLVSLRAWQVARGAFKFTTDSIAARERALWFIFAIALALLGINKQLDLQSLMTDIARASALEHGWYQNRRDVQRLFIVAVFFSALVAATSLLFYFRKVLFKHGLAIIGFCFLLAFIFIRATSFHASDILIHSRLAGLKINWLLECGGLLLILVNEWLLLKRWQR